MRLAWSAGALLAVARRWAGFLIVGAAVLNLEYFVAAIGWPALPVLWASSLPPPAGAAVLLLHALVAVALAWGLREALLPAHWLAAERALPLRAAQRAAADLAVAALAQSPLFALYLASLLSWWHGDPAWLRGHWPRGLGFMAASVALSLAGAAGLLALRRLPPRRRRHDRHVGPAAARRIAAWQALIVLPLWRGPARQALSTLALTFSVLLLCLAGAALAWPGEPRWCLAAYAFAAMAGCARGHALARRTLEPLLIAASPLPISARWGARALQLLALAPALLAWPLLLLAMTRWPLAPLAAPGYALAALLAPWVAASAAAGEQAEMRAARWLLALVIWVALATEILNR